MRRKSFRFRRTEKNRLIQGSIRREPFETFRSMFQCFHEKTLSLSFREVKKITGKESIVDSKTLLRHKLSMNSSLFVREPLSISIPWPVQWRIGKEAKNNVLLVVYSSG